MTGRPEFVRLRIHTDVVSSYIGEQPDWRPDQAIWILESSDGFESRFHRYRFRNQKTQRYLEVTPDEIDQYVDRSTPQRTLDIARIMAAKGEHCAAQPGEQVESEIDVEMFRRERGFLPLVTSTAALAAEFTIRGTALPRLAVTALDGVRETPPDHESPGGKELRWRFEPRDITRAGVIFSWRPRSPRSVELPPAEGPKDVAAPR